MTRLFLAILLVVEIAAIGLVSYLVSGRAGLLLVPVVPLTLVVALLVRHALGRPTFRARRLSPEAIVGYQARESRALGPEEISRSIVERAEEIRRTLLAGSPSEVQVEMCALGYRACVNDMITLTHLMNESSRGAGPAKRLRLRRHRRRATDALSAAREALPPSALRATPQEQQ